MIILVFNPQTKFVRKLMLFSKCISKRLNKFPSVFYGRARLKIIGFLIFFPLRDFAIGIMVPNKRKKETFGKITGSFKDLFIFHLKSNSFRWEEMAATK